MTYEPTKPQLLLSPEVTDQNCVRSPAARLGADAGVDEEHAVDVPVGVAIVLREVDVRRRRRAARRRAGRRRSAGTSCGPGRTSRWRRSSRCRAACASRRPGRAPGAARPRPRHSSAASDPVGDRAGGVEQQRLERGRRMAGRGGRGSRRAARARSSGRSSSPGPWRRAAAPGADRAGGPRGLGRQERGRGRTDQARLDGVAHRLGERTALDRRAARAAASPADSIAQASAPSSGRTRRAGRVAGYRRAQPWGGAARARGQNRHADS